MINWRNECLSRFVGNTIILSFSDYSKHKNYIHDFCQNNLENDIHTLILDCNELQLGLFSKCVFNNIDKTHYYPVLKLISILHNLINNNIEETKSLIVYDINGHHIYLND